MRLLRSELVLVVNVSGRVFGGEFEDGGCDWLAKDVRKMRELIGRTVFRFARVTALLLLLQYG
jgi:hypothetical protein